MARNLTTEISDNECIGDSLATINTNFENLDTITSNSFTTVTNYLSTNNVILSSVTLNGTFLGSTSATSIGIGSLSARTFALTHDPANDGVDPIFDIGETQTGSFSGFRIRYEEPSNRLIGSSRTGTTILTSFTITTNTGQVGISGLPAPGQALTVYGDVSATGFINTITNPAGYTVVAKLLSANFLGPVTTTGQSPIIYTVPNNYVFYPTGFGYICTHSNNPVSPTDIMPNFRLINGSDGNNLFGTGNVSNWPQLSSSTTTAAISVGYFDNYTTVSGPKPAVLGGDTVRFKTQNAWTQSGASNYTRLSATVILQGILLPYP